MILKFMILTNPNLLLNIYKMGINYKNSLHWMIQLINQQIILNELIVLTFICDQIFLLCQFRNRFNSVQLLS